MAKKQSTSKGTPLTGARDAALHVDRLGVSVNASAEREEAARLFAIEAARMLSDDKCEEVVVLDLRGRSQVTDFFVVGTGTSERQMHSSAQHVGDIGPAKGFTLFRDNLRDKGTQWVVLDFVDVVVHVFEGEARRYYDLEMLWGDAPRVEWERTTTKKKPTAKSEPAEDRNRAGLRRDEVL